MNIFMRKITSVFKKRANSRGQSLVELALVLALLLFMVIAIIEYGFMLNNYLNILDAGREAARAGSLIDPFRPPPASPGQVDPNFFVRPDLSQPSSSTNPPGISDLAEYYMCSEQDINRCQVKFDPSVGDDIVISFFSVSGGSVVRFPNATGWSRYGNHVSQFPDASVEALLNPSAPNTGVLVVEIYYNYPQRLNLPIFSSVIPNPIPLYTYSIMPLSAAEPTPTPFGH